MMPNPSGISPSLFAILAFVLVGANSFRLKDGIIYSQSLANALWYPFL